VHLQISELTMLDAGWNAASSMYSDFCSSVARFVRVSMRLCDVNAVTALGTTIHIRSSRNPLKE